MSKTIKKFGWEFPIGDKKLMNFIENCPIFNKRRVYQRGKYLRVLELIPKSKRDVAIDIGSHIGLWSWQMVQDFHFVYAFEPIYFHIDCFKKNTHEYENKLKTFPFALSNTDNKTLYFVINNSETRSIYLGESKKTTTPIISHTLDSQKIDSVSFIKIDCEGFELFILQGAIKTIQKSHPVIIVEQKSNTKNYGLRVILPHILTI